jgi:hypothetical protein
MKKSIVIVVITVIIVLTSSILVGTGFNSSLVAKSDFILELGQNGTKMLI